MGMKSTFAVALMCATVSAINQKEFEFLHFVAKWNKNFPSIEEYKLRLERYLEVDAFVTKVNSADSGETHKAAHN